jgi:spore maturation protein B
MTVSSIAALAVPLVVTAVGAICLFGRKNYFDIFLKGAVEGLHTAVGLLPTLIALLVAIRMLTASGLPSDLAELLSPAAAAIGLPAELLPLLFTRPFSGSAATAAYSALLTECGPDSFPALCASVIMGASDTVVYVCAVYFSAARVRHTRHALPCAFAVMLFSVFFSCAVCRFFFG